jgi:hypothetical protein
MTECILCDDTNYIIRCINDHPICINCFEDMTVNVILTQSKICPFCRSPYVDIYHIKGYELPDKYKFMINAQTIGELLDKIEHEQLDLMAEKIRMTKYEFVILLVELWKFLYEINHKYVSNNKLLQIIYDCLIRSINNNTYIKDDANLNNLMLYLDDTYRKKLNYILNSITIGIEYMMYKLLILHENPNLADNFISYIIEALIIFDIEHRTEDRNIIIQNKYLFSLFIENHKNHKKIVYKTLLSKDLASVCAKIYMDSVTWYDDNYLYITEDAANIYEYSDYIHKYGLEYAHIDNWYLPINIHFKVWQKDRIKMKHVNKITNRNDNKYHKMRKTYITKLTKNIIKPKHVMMIKYNIKIEINKDGELNYLLN